MSIYTPEEEALLIKIGQNVPKADANATETPKVEDK
jgi:hypothetical protein